MRIFSSINIIKYYNFYLYSQLSDFDDFLKNFTINNYSTNKKFNSINPHNKRMKVFLNKHNTNNKFEDFSRKFRYSLFQKKKDNKLKSDKNVTANSFLNTNEKSQSRFIEN